MNSCLPTRSKLVSRPLMAGGFALCEWLQTRFSPGMRRNGPLVVARPLAKGCGLPGGKRKTEKRLRDNARHQDGSKNYRVEANSLDPAGCHCGVFSETGRLATR